MNFVIVLILSLVLLGFALIAMGVIYLMRKRLASKGSDYRMETAEGGRHSRCACGRGGCCAIE